MGGLNGRVLRLTLAAALAGPSVSLAQVARPRAAAPPARTQATPGNRPATPARPQPRDARPAAQPNPARMKQVLREWESKSGDLKTLAVRLSRRDKDPAWNVDEEYRGVAYLQSPNLACLDFQKVVKGDDGKEKLVPHERIICTGSEVWQYKSDVRQVFIFPIDRQNQQRALEEGPLPFLFNMKAADAEARYQMDVVTEEPGFFVISIIPRLKIDMESFSKAFLQLNRTTFLPDRILLVSPNGKSTKDFKLFDVQQNRAIDARNFKGFVPKAGWKVERNPAGGGAAPAEQPRLGGQRPAPRVGNQPAPAAPAGAIPRRR